MIATIYSEVSSYLDAIALVVLMVVLCWIAVRNMRSGWKEKKWVRFFVALVILLCAIGVVGLFFHAVNVVFGDMS